MTAARLKVAFLIGRDDAGTRSVISRVCESPHIETLAVLLDTAHDPPARRWRNLKRNLRREGLSYIPYRVVAALREKLEDMADYVIPQQDVAQLPAQAFPDSSLAQLSRRRGFRVFEAGNLNGPDAIACLKSVGADLGIVLGTRILKRAIFSVPEQGCINLHKGKVPEYRGMPPGFWELFDDADSAGVTVHFVDDGLDTGDVLGEAEIPIHRKETPESLRKKLDGEGIRLMARVVDQIAQGTAIRRQQPKSSLAARTRPTRAQTLELARRLPHWRRLPDGRQAFKTAVWLMIYHGGVYSLVRRLRKGRSRGVILLYHRVNDVSEDVLTTSTRRFAEHLVTLRRYYRPTATEEIVERIRNHAPLEPNTVAIHFDDCYRDVRLCAAPLLAAADSPATAFVSSGFVDTDRVFRHDEEKYPHRFENLRTQDLRELPGLGVSVAAHTVNHVDLGAVSLDQARVEVVESRRQLEQMIAHPVRLFSFPFGRLDNIRGEVREMVVEAGYSALFSAHGGFIDEKTSLFDIPRIGVSSDHSPLALMMELEGISLKHLKKWLQSKFRFSAG
jgi:peptidoglycan/xylan/chitin deacetylase (PgdA/CDA1 family)